MAIGLYDMAVYITARASRAREGALVYNGRNEQSDERNHSPVKRLDTKM
jgi:hypothetical protein